MKESRAIGNHIRLAPRKARLVVDLIRGKSVTDALSALQLCRKGAAHQVRKILVSAMANAAAGGKPEGFVVRKASVDEGPMLKRYMPRAMGRATIIRKRTSRITIELEEREEKAKPLPKKRAAEGEKVPAGR
ncbi:MAG: 50S ribosomal protein L22 [bacterium]|jgi:large subunit ribosomal protein L22